MSTDETKAVVENHLKTFFENPDAIMDDYADDAAFITAQGVVKGKAAVEEFLNQLVGSLPPEMLQAFKVESLQADGDVAHMTWSAGSFCPLGSDTFVVREGKIVTQTFAAQLPS